MKRNRPQTGIERSRIIGDIAKFYTIQDPNKDKKVNFNSSRSEATLLTGFKRDNKHMDLSKVKPALKTTEKKRGVRPQTAKNYYTQNIEKFKKEADANRDQLFKPRNLKSIREAVIKYNGIDTNSKVILSLLI